MILARRDGRLGPPGVHGLHVALRVAKDRVHTAVWTLAHPTTGRAVTLVGTMHIGDPTYFRKLSSLLAGLAESGAEVHVEGISRGEGDCLSEWEEDRLAEADTWADAETAGPAVNLLRLKSQTANLQLREGTRNIDLSQRNGRAFAGATEALTRGDVVLVWGTDHLPGLARLFMGAGYRLRGEEWFESCSI